jgi:hypothetical protein
MPLMKKDEREEAGGNQYPEPGGLGIHAIGGG